MGYWLGKVLGVVRAEVILVQQRDLAAGMSLEGVSLCVGKSVSVKVEFVDLVNPVASREDDRAARAGRVAHEVGSGWGQGEEFGVEVCRLGAVRRDGVRSAVASDNLEGLLRAFDDLERAPVGASQRRSDRCVEDKDVHARGEVP